MYFDLWQQVNTPGMKGVAFEDPFDGHPEAQQTVRFDGLGGVDRAGRLEATGRRHER